MVLAATATDPRDDRVPEGHQLDDDSLRARVRAGEKGCVQTAIGSRPVRPIAVGGGAPERALINRSRSAPEPRLGSSWCLASAGVVLSQCLAQGLRLERSGGRIRGCA